ncbi:MAG: DUF4124 domain-containing protein [Betaproteobacteria bacterium]|nr:DUF4124 domain-containing protein [Betaproteobacteria bacterium]
MSDPMCAVCRSALLRSGLGALLAAWSIAGASQTTFKCLDARGKITYSNISCATQGMKDAGPVADRTMTVPMAAPKKPPPEGASKSPAKIDPEIGPLPSPAQIKPVNPLIEKLLK